MKVKANVADITAAEKLEGMAGSKVLEIELDASDVEGREYVRILVDGKQKGAVRIAPTPKPEGA